MNRAQASAPGRRTGVALLGIVALLLAMVLHSAPANAAPVIAAPEAGAPSSSGSPSPAIEPAIRVDLISISPRTPNASTLEQPVTITALVRNNSSVTYPRLRAHLERGEAIAQRALLHDAIATPPTTGQWSTGFQDQPGPLAPGGQQTITYVTSPGAMCLCFTGNFPYDLVVEGATTASDATLRSGTGFEEIGRASTLVPSLQTEPTGRLAISWVWPLIDQPHQLGTSPLFINDDLASSVAAGGRLDRSLQVIERVSADVRMTVVIDPRLLDELTTMTGGYHVRTGTGNVAGTGGPAAAAWLGRLRAVAASQDIVLTSYGDLDPDTAVASGESLSAELPPDIDARIRQVLGTSFRTDLAWPDAAYLSNAGLAATAAAGASTVLVSGAHYADQPTVPFSAMSSTPAGGKTVLGVALDPGLQQRVAEAVQRNALREAGSPAAVTAADTATSATRIQALLAELALWPVVDPGANGYVALAPDRRVDPEPEAAATAIRASVTAPWTTNVPLTAALAAAPHLSRGALELSSTSPAADLLAAIASARSQVAAASSLIGEPQASTLLSSARTEVRLASSSAWRTDPGRGVSFAQAAQEQARGITNGVAVVTPDNASYSLPSENSPLILTVRNTLPYPVQVRLIVTRVLGSPAGFTAEDVGVVSIEADGTRTLRVPAHFERSGRFQINAQLTTVSGVPLSDPVRLNVMCTAIGGVALAVTGIAFGLLVLLLLIRAVRGIRRRKAAKLNAMSASVDAAQVEEPPPAQDDQR